MDNIDKISACARALDCASALNKELVRSSIYLSRDGSYHMREFESTLVYK